MLPIKPRQALALFYCSGGLPDGSEHRSLVEAQNHLEALAIWLELRAIQAPVTNPSIREIKAA